MFLLPISLIWAILLGAVFLISYLTDTREDFLAAIKDYQVILAAGSALGVASLTYLGVWLKAEYDQRSEVRKLEHDRSSTEQERNYQQYLQDTDKTKKLALSAAMAAAGFTKLYDPGIGHHYDGYAAVVISDIEAEITAISEISPTLAVETTILTTAFRTMINAHGGQANGITGNFQASAKIAAHYLINIAERVASENRVFLRTIPKLTPHETLIAEVQTMADRHPSDLGYFAKFYEWPNE
ncbi:hypothetical protein [Roseibium alexandrii]|uniref:hypothetical protein n=1 Tax=Roseibium alexandrii TaxID=388408 RepID=UPI0037535288